MMSLKFSLPSVVLWWVLCAVIQYTAAIPSSKNSPDSPRHVGSDAPESSHDGGGDITTTAPDDAHHVQPSSQTLADIVDGSHHVEYSAINSPAHHTVVGDHILQEIFFSLLGEQLDLWLSVQFLTLFLFLSPQLL